MGESYCADVCRGIPGMGLSDLPDGMVDDTSPLRALGGMPGSSYCAGLVPVPE